MTAVAAQTAWHYHGSTRGHGHCLTSQVTRVNSAREQRSNLYRDPCKNDSISFLLPVPHVFSAYADVSEPPLSTSHMTRTKSGRSSSVLAACVAVPIIHPVAITKRRRAKLELRDDGRGRRDRKERKEETNAELSVHSGHNCFIILPTFCSAHPLTATANNNREGGKIKISGSSFTHLGPSLSPRLPLSNLAKWE